MSLHRLHRCAGVWGARRTPGQTLPLVAVTQSVSGAGPVPALNLTARWLPFLPLIESEPLHGIVISRRVVHAGGAVVASFHEVA